MSKDKDMSNNKNNDDIIIGWLSGGKVFKIYDEERFVREIMPIFFLGHSTSAQQQTFQTFQRNLDLWYVLFACFELFCAYG